VRLDAGRHEVAVRGERVALPLKEFELLELLLGERGARAHRVTCTRRLGVAVEFGPQDPVDEHVIA